MRGNERMRACNRLLVWGTCKGRKEKEIVHFVSWKHKYKITSFWKQMTFFSITNFLSPNLSTLFLQVSKSYHLKKTKRG